jgi:hypothetical protein
MKKKLLDFTQHFKCNVMLNGRTLSVLLFWTIICSSSIGRPAEAPLPVRRLVQEADPGATIEYCGSLSTAHLDYYLFLLARKELAGLVLIQQRAGSSPVIVDADTSLFPLHDDSDRTWEKSLPEGIELLLRRRNRSRKTREASSPPGFDSEVSAIGREIDRVVYPIGGFRLSSNSTREILRLLRTGPAVAVDPQTAPPGSIIVSPTQFSPEGPIYLGHAGIVGADGAIYSADARYGGARTRNFSLAGWLRQFSSTNGSYAFVLHVPSSNNIRGR